MGKQTLIAQQRSVIAFSAARICDLLQWPPARYNFFVYETGVHYLAAYFSKDEHAINQIEIRKQFWGWWKNEWHKRDEVYRAEIDGREDSISLDQRIRLYKSCHKVEILICEIAPPRISYPSDFTTIKMLLSCPNQQ